MKKRTKYILIGVAVLASLLVIAGVITVIPNILISDDVNEALKEADSMIASYDYDGAIEFIKSQEEYEKSKKLKVKVSAIEKIKSELVAVKPEEVTHVFYHSLLVDPERAFGGDQNVAAGFKQWMTTVDEFNRITEAMYNNGYVLISIYDLVKEVEDEDGNVHFEPNEELLLPKGKKAYVMSLDDLSYYHSYDNRGVASKLVYSDTDDDKIKDTILCEFIRGNGTVVEGYFDCVPLLDAFIEKHPDASYKGAKGTIALTGYNGVFGYRTDIAYKTRENLDDDQRAWLEDYEHSEDDEESKKFDWEEECRQAKVIADKLKENGWTFASHTWGHLNVGDVSLYTLQQDTEKWKAYVEPIVGETDIIIFAHGQDIAGAGNYSEYNEKFQYLKSEGFNYYCNVDSSKYFVQIEDNYVRQGRRNLDGYRLWNDVYSGVNYTEDLFDASEILDTARLDMPEL